jgi:hypothetical protein
MNTPLQQQLFGLLLPGQSVRTDFVPVDGSGTKFTILITDADPLTISDIVFFLLPGVILPLGTGAVLYWMVEGTAGFETFGAIFSERPSGVFSTGWANNDAILSAVRNKASLYGEDMRVSHVSITIAVSIEPLVNIENMGLRTKGVEDRILTAKVRRKNKLDYYLVLHMKIFGLSPLPPSPPLFLLLLHLRT